VTVTVTVTDWHWRSIHKLLRLVDA
jgi:hypothetical protein